MARTVTASVWVPALPPTPATIGISTASTASRSIECSNKRMIDEATKAVMRLAASQRTRDLYVSTTGSLMSPSPAPDSNKASSPASSWMMWTMSSTVIMPTSRPEGSTTAAEMSAYFWNRSATSSWSRSTGMRVCSRCMMASTRTVRGERRIVDSLHVPTGEWVGETTNTSQKSSASSSDERR